MKWILSRHTHDIDTLIKVLKNLKTWSIEKNDKEDLLNKLWFDWSYKSRNIDISLSTIDSKINQLVYYMFWYRKDINWSKKFLISPLWNLLLDNLWDKKKTSYIFLTMLWWLQYNHPFNKTDESIEIYPFRLIFNLLLDKRLWNILFSDEVSYLVMLISKIDKKSYDDLVNNILEFRNKTTLEKKSLFLKDEHTFVNAFYEWDYYTLKILKYFWLVNIFEWERLFSLNHWKSTTRYVNSNTFKINESILDYLNQLNSIYSYLEKPTDLKNPLEFKENIIKQIYNFLPEILINNLDWNTIDLDFINLPKYIREYSLNETNSGESYKFENTLEKAFNYFIDVKAKKISWAWNTDIECIYLIWNKKFAVEAKSTKNKLSWINSWRLERHRDKIWAKYTIIITPNYVPSVNYDIKNTDNVIIKSEVFAEYLHNCIISRKREISYKSIDDIIIENKWKDISNQISNLTFTEFALN